MAQRVVATCATTGRLRCRRAGYPPWKTSRTAHDQRSEFDRYRHSLRLLPHWQWMLLSRRTRWAELDADERERDEGVAAAAYMPGAVENTDTAKY